MSEDQADYVTEAVEMVWKGYDEQPAAIIESPRTVKALQDKGLVDYQVWGWVKMSAKFIAHLKYLKGAKLAIWQCIALSIDESGTCKKTLKEIAELTDYSHTEVIDSIKELEEAGYLSVNRDKKTNIYQPVFVARGEEKPKETLVKKLDSTPAYQYESSPSEENSVPSYRELKEFNKKPDFLDGEIHFKLKPETIRQAVKKYFRINVNWDTKLSREWMEWAVKEEITAEQISHAAEVWRTDKLFNWQPPTLKGIFEKWPMLQVGKDESPRPEHKPYIPEDDSQFVPRPS